MITHTAHPRIVIDDEGSQNLGTPTKIQMERLVAIADAYPQFEFYIVRFEGGLFNVEVFDDGRAIAVVSAQFATCRVADRPIAQRIGLEIYGTEALRFRTLS